MSPDREYGKGHYEAAERQYADYIGKHESDADPQVQNRVTVARIRRAYAAGKRKDFVTARARFIEAADKHKGNDLPSPDYGRLADQARYQAIVCLAADGKKEQALAEYRRFLIDRSTSSVCFSVIKRIHMLLPRGQWGPYDQLMNAAADKQNAIARRESAVCGPKALSYLLKTLGKGNHDYHDLAKLCGTNDNGTTMAGLKKGLADSGVESTGLLLNRTDFATVHAPAIWLGNDHYYVLLGIEGDEARIWDPKSEKESTIDLPPLDDTSFTATLLALNNPLEKGTRS